MRRKQWLVWIALGLAPGAWAADPAPARPDGGAAAETPAEKPADATRQMPGATVPSPELGKGMKKTGPLTWELTRDEVYQMVAGMPFIATQLWVRQVKKDGKLVGYKLKHISPDSLVYRAGFRNGDVVMRINGKPLKEPLQLLLELLDKDRAEIQLMRKGEVFKQVYLFVP